MAFGGVKIGLKTSFWGSPVRPVPDYRPKPLELRHFANFLHESKIFGSFRRGKNPKKGRISVEIAQKGCFEGVLGSCSGLSLFSAGPVPSLWLGLSAQSWAQSVGLGSVPSPLRHCVWLGGPVPVATVLPLRDGECFATGV